MASSHARHIDEPPPLNPSCGTRNFDPDGRTVFETYPTRSGSTGGAVSAIRSYVYDQHHRLCKTIEPETGATVQALDAANNLSWRASGLALTNPAACDTASVPAANKVSHAYDSRNRLTATSFGDASPAVTRSYTPDGLPATVASNGST